MFDVTLNECVVVTVAKFGYVARSLNYLSINALSLLSSLFDIMNIAGVFCTNL